MAAALGGALVMATGVVLAKRWASPAPLLATTGWQLVAGGLLLLPVALLVEGPPPAGLTAVNLGGYAYLSLIGAAVAYALWFRGIRELPPTAVSFLGLLSPVVATLLGVIVAGSGSTPSSSPAEPSSSPPSWRRSAGARGPAPPPARYPARRTTAPPTTRHRTEQRARPCA
ncbi:EamA family transporter [Streptomyces zhihengii]